MLMGYTRVSKKGGKHVPNLKRNALIGSSVNHARIKEGRASGFRITARKRRRERALPVGGRNRGGMVRPANHVELLNRYTPVTTGGNYEREAIAAMIDHPIIDVTLGLVFIYVLLSLLASGVQEWIASVCSLRSNTLRSGVQNLIGDNAEGNCVKYMEKMYDHPLIKNLAKRDKFPSYILPETLSTVLLDVIAREGTDKSASELGAKAIIKKINAGHPLKGILGAMIVDDDTAKALQNRLAEWFDEGMTRVSGWYNRRAKLFIFFTAAAVTVATNASSLHIVEELWRNDALRTQIAVQAQAAAQAGDLSMLWVKDLQGGDEGVPDVDGAQDTGDADGGDTGKSGNEYLAGLETLPIGWNNTVGGWPDCERVLGWLITTIAVSLGAPFWFDLLGKVANLRGTGGKAQTHRTP